MAIQTLTGGEFYSGSATSNAQSDTVEVNGYSNTIWEQLGNLTVSSGATPPTDSYTTVRIGGIDVTDTITLAGSGNLLYDFGSSSLVGATVNYTVAGNGTGGNIVGDNAAIGAPLTNTGGTTNITLSGSGNQVYLNGNATNTIALGNGNGIAFIGSFADDDLFGYSTSVSFGGSSNFIVGGDENFTVTNVNVASSGGNGVFLGDGTDSVTLLGTHNEVLVGGGSDTIDTGGSNAVVYIFGVDQSDAPPPGPDGSDDSGVPASPTDTVTIRGSSDTVAATYENVIILGLAVTSTATIDLGNGNNKVFLGGTGGDIVTVGTGNNTIAASGDGSSFNVGDGINSVTLTGDGNLVVVNDPTGVGNDTINLGTGSGNQIFLDHAAGAVADSGTGTTHVTQNSAASNVVTVSLGGGTGLVSLGEGSDTVTANGAGSVIVAGDGADTVTANGGGDVIHLGNGGNTVTANGGNDIIVLGNGGNTVHATGSSDYIVLGNGNNALTVGNTAAVSLGNGNNTVTGGNGDIMVFGNGSNHVTVGSAGVLSFHSNASSVNTVSVGGGEYVFQQNGILNVTEPLSNTGGDVFDLTSLAPGSSLTILGNNDQINFGGGSTAALTLNPSVSGETISVYGDNPTAYGNYSGALTLSGFGLQQTMDLQGLIGGVDHNDINSYSEVLANLNPSTPYNSVELQGGGAINFLNPTQLSATEFAFSGPGTVPLPV